MPVPPCAHFLAAVDAWCTWLTHSRGRAGSTVERYRQHLERLGDWFADPPDNPKHRPIAGAPLDAKREDLELFTGELAHLRGMRPRSRLPLVSAVRGFYAWALSAGRIRANPAASLPQPAAGRPLPKPAQLATAEALLMAPDISTLRGVRDAAMLAMLMGCGLRVSGLLSLNESALVWYRDDSGADRLMLRVTEKGDRTRGLPVPHEAALLLRAYLGHEDLAAIDRTLPNGDRVLFVGLRNQCCPAHLYHGERRRLHRRTVHQMMQGYAVAAGLPLDQCHPHALRHLYGAELAESEANILHAQALMGHAKAETTEIYAHLATRQLTVTVDRANPLTKMRAPILDTLRSLQRSISPGHARSGPASARKA